MIKKLLLVVIIAAAAFVIYKGPSGVVGLLFMSHSAKPATAEQTDILGQPIGNNGQKVLVAYFSWGGNTRKTAAKIHALTGGDLYEIRTAEPYPADYKPTVEIAKKELEQDLRPQLGGTLPDLTQYDVIILGYPIWWGIEPMAVKTFVESADLSGKTILPFATSGGSGVEESVADLRKTLPNADVKDGLLANISSKIEPWLRDNGMLAK